MKLFAIQRLTHSLYLRLLLIFSISFLLIFVSVGLAFRLAHGPKHRKHFRRNIHQYANYLVNELGTPPNITKAKQLKNELGLDFIILYDQESFSTSEKALERYQERCKRRRVKRHRRCRGFKEVRRKGYRYILAHPTFWDHDAQQITLALSLSGFFIFLILLVSYRLVRVTLRPVKEMQQAASDFADGKWTTRLQSKRCDELGNLARAMDNMAAKIERNLRSARDLQVAISHELRSPLARMRVASEFIKDDKVRRSLNEEIYLLDRLTANLLERERLESPDVLNRVATDLGVFVQTIVESFDDRVVLHDPQANMEATIDVDRLALCLRSIIENALKYSDKQVVVHVESTDRQYLISVQDEGIGIAASDLPRVTEPFFRVDPSRSGSRDKEGFGLGLSLCQAIVSAHGGKLEILSELQEGTTVNISLPRHQKGL